MGRLDVNVQLGGFQAHDIRTSADKCNRGKDRMMAEFDPRFVSLLPLETTWSGNKLEGAATTELPMSRRGESLAGQGVLCDGNVEKP